MQPIFNLQGSHPFLVCSLSDSSEADLISTMRNAVYDGADGFLLHLEKLDPACQNREALARIFSYAENKPVLTVNYRYDHPEIPDETLAALQLEAVAAGAGCVDMMGDLFGSSPFELATDPVVVEKQKEYIAAIHAGGAQVMVSSHLWAPIPTEQMLAQALEMERRGADIVKIAMKIDTEEQLLEGIRATALLRDILDKPFLFIMMGQHGKAHRVMAPVLGSCMVLCVQRYTPRGHKDKPLLRAVRAVYQNLDYQPTR